MVSLTKYFTNFTAFQRLSRFLCFWKPRLVPSCGMICFKWRNPWPINCAVIFQVIDFTTTAAFHWLHSICHRQKNYIHVNKLILVFSSPGLPQFLAHKPYWLSFELMCFHTFAITFWWKVLTCQSHLRSPWNKGSCKFFFSSSAKSKSEVCFESVSWLLNFGFRSAL